MAKGKKWLLLLATAAMVVSVIAGCGSKPANQQSAAPKGNEGQKADSSKQPIELTVMWWGSQDRHDRTLKVIDMYEKEHPNVKIKSIYTGWDGYWEKLATQVAGKKMPDIVQMDYKYLNEYASRGTLLDMNPLVQKGVINLSDVDENAIVGGKVDGKLFALNLGSNSPAIAYDPEIFKKAGVELKPGYTWDDLAKAAKQIKDKTGVYGFEPMSDMNGFKHYLRDNGLWVYNKKGDALGYDDDKYLVDYFSFWRKLIDEGSAAPADQWVATKNQVENRMFVHAKAAMGQLHSNQITAMMKGAGRSMDLAILPSVSGGKLGHFLKPSQFFSISSTTKYQEEAAKFVDYFTNDIKANEVLAAERGVPISKKVRDALAPKMGESGKKMFEYMDVVQKYSREIDPPDPNGATEIEKLFENLVQAVDYGKSTPEQAAKEFREKASAVLKKNDK
jgi:multiple sugar transport system substrate-binding protein